MLKQLQKLPKKYSVPLFILFIIGLYVLQSKVITPFVMRVIESDVFFAEEDAEEEELGKISNERTSLAFVHCKNAMKEENHVPETAQFADADYEAWALGGRTYIIRSHVAMTTEEKGQVDRKYACKIKFSGGDVTDSNNWSILAVDFTAPSEDE